MLHSSSGKHTLAAWHERKTPTLLLLQSLAPGRAASQEPPNSLQNSGGILPGRRPKPDGPRRELLPKRSRRRCLRERCPVTVCAAVMCRTDPNEDQEILLGIADRMVTWGERIESEPTNQTKFFAFSPAPKTPTNIVALASGELDAHADIAERTHQEAMRTGVVDVRQMARLYSENFACLRRERAEGLYLHPLGLDMESFIASQRTMQPREVAHIRECLQNEYLNVETIIAGVDAGGPHIYSVGGFRQAADGIMRQASEAACHDSSGFRAVGVGADQFEMQFQLLGYDRAWPLMDALLLTNMAKKQAEKAPGVGAVTDMFIIRGETGLHTFPPEAVEGVERYRAEYEREVTAQRLRIIEAMRQKVKIVWETEQAKGTS